MIVVAENLNTVVKKRVKNPLQKEKEGRCLTLDDKR